MFNKVLIANRGEIAVRIIRACKELKLNTVAVYSTADKDALHTQLADEAVCIGPPKSKDSYLNMHNIISATIKTRAQAIHPGFGFLSENSIFASICNECNIKFIGPQAKTIYLMGNKTNAKKIMKKAGVPLIPGSEGNVETLEDAFYICNEIGYPVVIKATNGGGGKGIRIVKSKDTLKNSFISAKNEAKEAFGNDSVYIEKLIEKARHIEVQILADEHGNIVHLGERDCSIQKNNQKLIEETPSVAIDNKKRNNLGKLAIKAAKVCNYQNAGTLEFLFDGNNFYFMEMNTRIQVEHPITEMTTGIDIVKQQIKIALGEKIPFSQNDIKLKGHSIECRINALTPGKINYLFLPSGCMGLRVDTALYSGYIVPPTYDSMIAKVIATGDTRGDAISIMKRALDEFVIDGIKTNIDYQMKILNDRNFVLGNFDITFVNKFNKS